MPPVTGWTMFNTCFSDFQFRWYGWYGVWSWKKVFICKQTLRVSQTSVNIARHCAVKDCENGDYALEKWKETHSCSTRTLSRICTCDEPSR